MCTSKLHNSLKFNDCNSKTALGNIVLASHETIFHLYIIQEIIFLTPYGCDFQLYLYDIYLLKHIYEVISVQMLLCCLFSQGLLNLKTEKMIYIWVISDTEKYILNRSMIFVQEATRKLLDMPDNLYRCWTCQIDHMSLSVLRHIFESYINRVLSTW